MFTSRGAFRTLLIALLLLSAYCCTASSALTFTVTNCANDGAGSLRWAITSAEAAGGNSEIIFDITTAEAGYSTGGQDPGLVNNEGQGSNTWFRIIVGTSEPSSSELPTINSNGISILGSTQTREAQNTLGPRIEIVCLDFRPYNGLTLKGNNCTIEGLAINHFNSVEAAAILLDSGADHNVVKNCNLGIRPIGDWELHNYHGIRINDGTYNVIGGTIEAERNLISGNYGHGVYLNTSSTASNEVRNNYIGINRDSSLAVANSRCGIFLNGATNNIIDSNVVSGHNTNSQSGIGLYGASVNIITGNKLGTNALGTGSLPNYYGISMEAGGYNTIGGSTEAERNIISGNSQDGIKLSSDSNTIKGNYIGLTSAGGALGNGLDGIRVYYGRYNIIGGNSASEGNYIGNNTYAGISFSESGAASNEVKNNFIGRSPGGGDAGNGGPGVYMYGGMSIQPMHNQIGPGNYIANNDQYGIWLQKSNFNLITQNSMEANAGKGIYLEDANNGIASPEVLGAVRDPVSGIITIEGTYFPDFMITSVIEVFKTEPNPEQPRGEGLVYLGSAEVNPSGTWTLVYAGGLLSVGDKVCATKTNLVSNGYTSEFSRNRSVYPTNTVFRWENDGPGTLRRVISSAEVGAEIVFNLTSTESDSTSGYNNAGGRSWFLIQIMSPITIETSSLYIHGSTQTREVSNPDGPTIDIHPYDENWVMNGIDIAGADNCTLEGLAISGFKQSGCAAIRLTENGSFSPASYNNIKNCYINSDVTGSLAGQTYYGIYLDHADHALIGGPDTADRNLIVGCANNGIYISQFSTSNEVRGNYIGIGRDGWVDLGNLDDGICVHDSYDNLMINNLISCHDSHADDAGIKIEGTASVNNQMRGNLIGTDFAGSTARANSYGILLDVYVTNNRIGGANPSDRNVISGNTDCGIYLRWAGTNEVWGNYIGLNQAGTTALANGTRGILILSAPDVVVRDNVISGHNGMSDSGIELTRMNPWDPSSDRARIFGNKIGTDANGTTAVPNYWGIYNTANTYRCVIGGTTEAERNIISGNSNFGINLTGSSTNEIKGNYIGLSQTGSTLGNSAAGIYLNDACENLIGGDSINDRNYIGGNGDGIHFQYNSTSNEVKGNYIGRSPTGGNVGNTIGISLNYGTMWPYPPPNSSFTTIGPYNYFSYNQIGVAVNNNNYVVITRNTMEANTAYGIEIYPGMNNNIQPPGIITAYYRGAINKTILTGTAAASSVVELFTASMTPGGFPFPPPGWEGKTFLGSVEANGSGDWVATLEGVSTGDQLVATATKYESPGYTSKFSAMGEVAIQPPSVEVSSPAGGEKWKGGTTHDIIFTCTDEAGIVPNSADLYYSTAGPWIPIATGQPTDAAYSWNPIPSLDSNTVQVKVTVMDIDGNQGTGESASNFTIDSTPPTVTVNAPNGGEKWQGGTSKNITWNATDVLTGVAANSITIEARYSSGGAYNMIISGEANDGTYSWPVPSLNTNEARVRISAADEVGNIGSDTSNADFIIDITPPSIPTLEAPPHNTTTNDATTTFLWQASTDNLSGIASYEITIDTQVVTLGAVTTYTTPDALSDAQHSWKVRAKDGAGIWGDFSPTWLVTVEATTPECSAIVLKDRITGSIVVSSSFTVSLEAQGVQDTPIIMRIAQDSAFTENDTGWIAFQNPTEYAFTSVYGTREAYFKMRNSMSAESQVYSDSIIIDQPTPTLEVVNPSGGEFISGRRYRDIRGEIIPIEGAPIYYIHYLAESGAGFPPNPITLYYSVDNGQTWNLIAAGLENTGSYPWSVPQLDSSQCLISVEVVTLAGEHVYSQSQGDFTIDSTFPTIVTITPTNGSTSVPVSAEVVVTFSGEMSREACELSFSLSTTEGTFSWSGSDTILTFTPSAPLLNSTLYFITVTSGCRDKAGNPVLYPLSTRFTTESKGDVDAPKIVVQTVDLNDKATALKNGDYISKAPKFRADITDNLALDRSTLKFFVDDLERYPIVTELSADHFRADVTIPSNLEDESIRTHTVKVQISDTSANASEKTVSDLKVSNQDARVVGTPITHPQPFSPERGGVVTIAYHLSADSDVRILGMATDGRMVWNKQCLSGTEGGRAGYNEVGLRGTSDIDGSRLGNGVYIVRLVSKGKAVGTVRIVVFD